MSKDAYQVVLLGLKSCWHGKSVLLFLANDTHLEEKDGRHCLPATVFSGKGHLRGDDSATGPSLPQLTCQTPFCAPVWDSFNALGGRFQQLLRTHSHVTRSSSRRLHKIDPKHIQFDRPVVHSEQT